MSAIPERAPIFVPEKSSTLLPALLQIVLPVAVGVGANLLFWSGALLPFNPVETEFFAYLIVAVIWLSGLLAVAGGVMALVCGLKHFSCAAFNALAANSTIATAAMLLLWGVVFSAA